MEKRVMRLFVFKLMVLIGAMFLVGCAIVDQYSGRAVVYNLQAEQAEDQGLLLNIVRAYLGRPMQFTTVSTITGTASVAGTAQYSFPVNMPFRQSTTTNYPTLPTWLFGGSVSGGPAFTVPVLDTQEFYQGIMKPINAQIWDLYIQTGYPRDLLFNLFVEKIVMRNVDKPKRDSVALSHSPASPDRECVETDHTENCEFVFVNDVDDSDQHRLFQAFGDYLMWAGLTTESRRMPVVSFKGDVRNINVRFVGGPRPSDDPDFQKAQVLAPPIGTASVGSEGEPKRYRLCFAAITPKVISACIVPTGSSVCGYPEKKESDTNNKPRPPATSQSQRTTTSPAQPSAVNQVQTRNDAETKSSPVTEENERVCPPGGCGRRGGCVVPEAAAKAEKENEGTVTLKISDEQFVQKNKYEPKLKHFAERVVTLKFYLRSTEGMIAYLGKVARRQLDPGSPGLIFVKKETPNIEYPKKDSCYSSVDGAVGLIDGSPCHELFVIKEGAPTDFLSVEYEGRWFSIPGGHEHYSSMVLDILRQLIALNSSAKTLPQSSVLVVGPQ
jgi:hypothetical protein